MTFSNQFAGPEIYVSPAPVGADTQTVLSGSGTFTDPYHSIAKGIAEAEGGGRVFLRGGQYVEYVDLAGVAGKWWRRIVVRPHKDEQVTIDCLIPEFLQPGPNAQWEAVPDGGPDEYIWTRPFDKTGDDPLAGSVRKGAFLDRDPYTRLVTYDQLQDLRAENQLWPKDLPSGNRVWVKKKVDGQTTFVPSMPPTYRPWVYMGPGIWFDADESRKLHLRLSHTDNHIDGWDDYTGSTNPEDVRLGFSLRETHALRMVGCHHIRFENLAFRFGDEDTIRLRNCSDIVFDHVQVRAASRAIRLQNNEDNPNDDLPPEQNRNIVFQHCEIDGGVPTWFFRSDRKDNYFFGPDTDEGSLAKVPENRLGASTSGVLVSSGIGASNVTVHHCELVNGHDIYIFGSKMSFHHNWVNNINDDALNMGAEQAGTDDAQIYRNVITRCLTGLSFAAEPPGYVQIFRNLFDLREPTLGIRPADAEVQRSLRQGAFFKDGNPRDGVPVAVGPIDLWHNTCLVLNPGAVGDNPEFDDFVEAGFAHYQTQGVNAVRRAFNNIFVAAYPIDGKVKSIAFLPPSTFAGPTDGNLYHRVGPDTGIRFMLSKDATGPGPKQFDDLENYKDAHEPYEANGHRDDPMFRVFDQNGMPFPDADDLRLEHESPARNSPVALPDDLPLADRKADGLPFIAARDRGCYRWAGDILRVGVDGRRRFPANP